MPKQIVASNCSDNDGPQSRDKRIFTSSRQSQLILLLLALTFTVDRYVYTVESFTLSTAPSTVNKLPVPPLVHRGMLRIITNTYTSRPLPNGGKYLPTSSVIAAAMELPATKPGGTYRPFAEYAWSQLSSSGLIKPFDENDDGVGDIPLHLRNNSSPARGKVEGSVVSVEIKSRSGSISTDGGDTTPALRLARYALLETLSPSSPTTGDETNREPTICVPDAIHVLNLVLFPNPTNPLVALPVLGVDLVTLPGGKHLIAIDFQPVLPPTNHTNRVFREGTKYAHYEDRLALVHRKHVIDQPDVLPWGGDVPPNAKRFFSPYVLWTRLVDKDGSLKVVQKEVFEAFVDYFDLYLELLKDVQKDSLMKEGEVDDDVETLVEAEGLKGQRDYLLYRLENDPGRPMLSRLYGKEWCEEAIAKVLFKMV